MCAVDIESTPEIEVYSTICDLIDKALAVEYYANLLYSDDGILYLCDPINPYHLVGDELIKDSNVEYYLIRSSKGYVSCVTVCYDEDGFLSANYNDDISAALMHNNIDDEPFELVTEDQSLYIIVGDGIIAWNSALQANEEIESILQDDTSTFNLIHRADCNLESVSVNCILPFNTSQITIPRYAISLPVPIVSQENYPICWAAAAVAFGRYYTGSEYASVTPVAFSYQVINKIDGGTFEDVKAGLKSIYKIDTDYLYSTSYSTIINYLTGGKPLIAGFYDDDKESGHMAIISGFSYNSGSSIVYYIVDSNYPNLQIVSTTVSKTLTLNYYSEYNFEWTMSLYRVT